MKITEKTVVHCSTGELAKQVLQIAHESGYRWNSGGSLQVDSYWEVDRCYNFWKHDKEVTFKDVFYYRDKGYDILSAEQFLKDNNINLTTMKDLKYFQTKTLRVNNVKRDITIAVYLKDNELYGGYSVRNPTDIQHDSEKAKLIATGRAMNERTNLLKGESVGSLNHRYILKAIAENLLREIELGNIIIKGIR